MMKSTFVEQAETGGEDTTRVWFSAASGQTIARSGHYGALEYRLYRLAGAARFGPSLVIETLHLTDGTLSQ